MRRSALGRIGRWLPLLGLAAGPASAQEAQEEIPCQPGQVTAEGRCIRGAPEAQTLGPGSTRRTPFRIRSMMPGHVGEAPARSAAGPPLDAPATAPAAVPAGGFGVQFGVYSDRAAAVAVAEEAASQGQGPFRIAPMPRGNRILWACIHGPFPDKESAEAAGRLLRASTRFQEAFVKPLDGLKLEELDHVTAQK